MSKEGSTEAPIRHPINFDHPDFLDPKKLDDEMRKLTVSQANSNWGKSDNDIAALPKFKPGSDIPVFTLPNELTGIMEEVPAEILGRAVKFGVNVIYVRDLNGKKVEMMIPSMNTFVEAPNTTKKQNNNKFNKGSGKGKYSKKKSNNDKIKHIYEDVTVKDYHYDLKGIY